ncbi:MAG TPA: hypothetical protein PKY78_04320 [Candidatus Omnitrophota bacterium]|nr:hypothetical protein [Candidatus Omnitrophota bacterium]HPS20196.1 hypothetical protein [Candidatus Omnitrophota bacterium]
MACELIMGSKHITINKIYDVLNGYFGDLKWWPAETAFEMMVGAILTQNTSWKNVEKAILELKKKKLLVPKKIIDVPVSGLSTAIRSSGYHRVKAGRLKQLARFIMSECGGDLKKLSYMDTRELREKLLSVKGIGPETADSILLYAFGKKIFVVDAYTKRIFSRHGILVENALYSDVQNVAHKYFKRGLKEYNQYHALIVETAKKYCRKHEPLCDECPIRGIH